MRTLKAVGGDVVKLLSTLDAEEHVDAAMQTLKCPPPSQLAIDYHDTSDGYRRL